MGSSHPTPQYKMFRPLFFAPLAIALVLLQQVPTSNGTVAFTLASGTTTLLSLTAAQSTALAAVAVLGIKAKLIGGYLLSRRGKRSAEEEELSLETFANLEVEDCYKRVNCAASTGEVENPQVQNVLALFNPVQFMQAPPLPQGHEVCGGGQVRPGSQVCGQVRAQVHLQPRHGHPPGLVLNCGAEKSVQGFPGYEIRELALMSVDCFAPSTEKSK